MQARKIISLFVVLVAAVTVWGQGIDEVGTPDVYKMTFQKLEMRQQADQTWVTVNEEAVTVDLANVDPEEFAGAMAGGKVPYGTYDAVRSTVSMQITIRGAVVTGGKVYYTTAEVVDVDAPPGSNGIPGTGCVPGVMDLPPGIATAAEWVEAVETGAIDAPADYDECTVQPPTTGETKTVTVTDDEGGVTIAEGGNLEFTATVDVAGSINLVQVGPDPVDDLILFPGPPVIEIE